MRENAKKAARPAWKNKLKLGRGQTLRLVESGNAGNLGQRDVGHYEVVDSAGQVVGSVEFSEFTNLKPPFLSIRSLVQKDNDGKSLLETKW